MPIVLPVVEKEIVEEEWVGIVDATGRQLDTSEIVAALNERGEADRNDAERYRWIKQHARHVEIRTLTQMFGMGPTDLDRVLDVARREPDAAFNEAVCREACRKIECEHADACKEAAMQRLRGTSPRNPIAEAEARGAEVVKTMLDNIKPD